MTSRKIIDLEWPTRYLLECGHAVAIAPDASVADMAMPGQDLPCPTCGGDVQAPGPTLLTRFKAGEAINAMTLNSRFDELERLLLARGLAVRLARFTPDEPINAQTLNERLDAIAAALGA